MDVLLIVVSPVCLALVLRAYWRLGDRAHEANVRAMVAKGKTAVSRALAPYRDDRDERIRRLEDERRELEARNRELLSDNSRIIFEYEMRHESLTLLTLKVLRKGAWNPLRRLAAVALGACLFGAGQQTMRFWQALSSESRANTGDAMAPSSPDDPLIYADAGIPAWRDADPFSERLVCEPAIPRIELLPTMTQDPANRARERWPRDRFFYALYPGICFF